VELATILKKFFFEIGLDKKMYSIKQELSKNINLDTNPNEINKVYSQSLKSSENIISKNFYKTIKLEGIKIISKQLTKKANNYRVNYRDKCQNSGFFFVDSYFRDKKEVIQPNLVGDFWLSKGYKYQFFYGFS